MRVRMARNALAFSAALMLITFLAGAGPAQATGAPLPTHVYAPYFETWTSDSLTTLATASGTTHFTMAFLETLGKNSCTLAWNGSSSQTIASGRYLSDIASLRAMGGDVIPSFGGWSADQAGTEIGDSCKEVGTIAAAYEQVITTYDVTRLDMDIEGRSLTRSAGIDRRNRAIRLVQDWAIANGRSLTIQYTLPTSAGGLDAAGLAVLQNAVADGVRIDLVNPMVFDYYDGTTTDMGAAAISASKGLHRQLMTLLPGRTAAQVWALQGATMMNGVDDYPKKTEITTLADARTFRDFAALKGMRSLSIWAIQRDNGGCPGARAANDCSGIVQNTWDFSHALEQFTGP